MYCKLCNDEVAYADIVSGMEVDGNLVIITADERESLKEEQGEGIELLQFANADEVDPIMYEGTYYLEPEGNGDGYALLRQVLIDSGRIGIVRYAMRQKTHLGVLRVLGNVLVVHTIMWPDEVRPTTELKVPTAAVPAKALKMAHLIVDSMTEEFNPEDYKDEYQIRLQELVDAKADNAPFVTKAKDLDDDAIDDDDLIARLEATIKRHPAGKKAAARRAPVKAPAQRRRRKVS